MAHPAPTSAPLVTVAISVLDRDVAQVVLPPAQPEVTYLVCLQGDAQAAAGLQRAARDRSDLRILPLSSRGLSRSRNAALEAAATEFLVFSDADIELNPAGILDLARAMQDAPDHALSAGWREDRLAMASPKRRQPHLLHYRTAGRVCAPELMVRPGVLRSAGLWFDPDFGLGARHGLGEEYVLITDALKAGLTGQAWPIVTGAHPDHSTGTRASTPELWRARQAMLRRVFGRMAVLARLPYAWHMRGHMRSGIAARLWDMVLFGSGGIPRPGPAKPKTKGQQVS